VVVDKKVWEQVLLSDVTMNLKEYKEVITKMISAKAKKSQDETESVKSLVQKTKKSTKRANSPIQM